MTTIEHRLTEREIARRALRRLAGFLESEVAVLPEGHTLAAEYEDQLEVLRERLNDPNGAAA